MRRFDDIVLVPDSFKGTMSALEVCEVMEEVLLRFHPEARIRSIPVADGGEGSVEAFLTAMGGEKVEVDTTGPYHEPRRSFYGMLPDGTAVIEMAAAAGLPLVGENKHAGRTSTYGVGALMLHAARSGATRIIMGLGGSATNDGACGCAAACGINFLDENGHKFIPVGETLDRIAFIDRTGLDPSLRGVEIVTMCDIDNPLCGPSGASAVFGPQKGATPAMVEVLDANLAYLAHVIERDLGADVLHIPGAGAAGGMGAGMVAFFDSPLEMGIEVVLDTVKFDELLESADAVFSGEGYLDGQSLHGKVVIGVARRCRAKDVPLYAVVGGIDDTVVPAAVDAGVHHMVTINRTGVPLAVAILQPRENLAATMRILMEKITCDPDRELPARIHLQEL